MKNPKSYQLYKGVSKHSCAKSHKLQKQKKRQRTYTQLP